ncbi:MAG: T9SS type A sorting domain-containing protein [Saprospiraceae bacterium]|nr:T9SS type A sorting domain-containing protein [Saprospiraceae bacterium]
MITRFLLLMIAFNCLADRAFTQQYTFNFEDWQKYDLYEEPAVYETANFQSYFSTFSPNVTKVKGPVGNAIRLENKRAMFDTTIIPGLIYLGDLVNLPNGGFPFTKVPDSLGGLIRYNMVANDTGFLVLIFKRTGIPVSFNVFPIVGQQNQFTRFSLPLIPSGIAPDTVFFLLASGNLDNPKEGSFIELEELTFPNTLSQMPNHDFEKWEDVSFEEPEQWASTNLISALLRLPQTVVKSTDANEGNYSLQLEHRQINKLGINLSAGFCTIGETGSGQATALPFKATKLKVSYSYKYEPKGLDTAWVVIRAVRYNPQIGGRELVHIYAAPLQSTRSYTSIDHTSPAFIKESDSIYVEIYAGNFYPGMPADKIGKPKPGSKLWIDNLVVRPTSENSIDNTQNQITISPQPAKDFMEIRVEEPILSYRILDASGKSIEFVGTYSSFDSTNRINISHLDPGSYFIQWKTNSGYQVKSFLVIK